MPMRSILAVLLAICLQAGFTQQNSPYILKWQKELPLLGTGLILMGTGSWAVQQLDPLSVEDIGQLDASDINGFDRNAIENFSTQANDISDLFLYGSIAPPLSLLIDKQIRSDFAKVSILFLETVLISQGLTTLTKGLAKRTRPFAYNPEVEMDKKLERTARTSFYSGHTGTVSAFCFFSAKVFSDYHPDSKWKPVVWGAAGALPAITGYLRVKAGKHFPTDVMTGYVVCGAIGYFIPHIHRSDGEEQMSLQFQPGLQGPGFTFRYRW